MNFGMLMAMNVYQTSMAIGEAISRRQLDESRLSRKRGIDEHPYTKYDPNR
ncbi:hypothetical protein [Cohnella sp. GbtcB17]|uniref:hypothetical protein n=1 Tax=Cohnella sp. GbtcB17 TaxID=2824762 RepID=UPI001C2F6F0F|nr:hypothetical protein [Cohnella sp. GbtcB17]